MLNATRLHEQGKIHEAKLAYEEFLIQNPDNAQAIHLLGIACYQLGELDRAYKLISRAINLQPDNAAFYCNRGLVLQQFNRAFDALVDYQKSISINSNNSASHNNCGNALQDLCRYEQAIECYKKAIRINPNYSEAYNNLGNAYRALHQYTDAINAFDRALTLTPNYAQAHSNLGIAFFECDRFKDAISSYKKAIAIDQNFAEAINNLGNVHKKLHQLNEALACFTEAATRLPNFAIAHYNRAEILQELGRLNESLLSYQSAISIKPLYPEAFFNLGFVQARLGLLDLAVGSVQKALEQKLFGPDQALPANTQKHQRTDYETNEHHLWSSLGFLAEAGIKAFPCSGTLLGLIREKRLLPWDKDIDIGVPFEQFQAAVNCLVQKHWMPRPNNLRITNKLGLNHPSENVVIDLTGFKSDPKKRLTIGGFWQDNQRPEWQRITIHPEICLEKLTRNGNTVYMLSNSEEWLNATYGDWRTPDPHWDSVIAARNLKGFSLLTHYYALNRLWTYFIDGKISMALSIAHRLEQSLPEPLYKTIALRLQIFELNFHKKISNC